MKKRILALALAGTTAFSVFGGLNVFAAGWTNDSDNGYAYKQASTVQLSLNGNGHIDTGDLSKIAFAFEDREDGEYYVGDWALADKSTAAKRNRFQNLVAKAVKDPTGYNDTSSAYSYEKVKTALEAAYDVSNSKVTLKDADDARYDLKTAFNVVDDYFSADQAANATVADLNVSAIEDVYDFASFNDYDAEYLFVDIFNAYKGKDATLSTYEYLADEYERIMGDIDPADHSDKIDLYEHYLEAASTLTESDYEARVWADIEDDLRRAEIEAADGKWQKAIDYLESALTATPKKGDYKELEATLMSMYADDNGRTYARYIKEDYASTKTPYTLYKAADYTIKKGVYTDEWEALFEGTIWYYNPLDAVDAETATGIGLDKKDLYEGVYGYAYELYTEAKSGKVAQTRLDTANDMLIEALEALDPTTSSAEWELVKLEKTVELAETLVDTDFNANSTKWKTFTKNLEKAQEILAKSNASKSEVTNITTALNGSMMALETVAKNPSYTLVKEYKAVLKDAKDALKEIEDQNATQYKTLMAAINDAETLGTWLDVNERDKDCYVALSSDYEEAIAALENAIAGYEHPQGWYQDEAGTWFYGVGTENYTGWLEINGRNYFLKDDGSMAASTWVKTDKGYWYYLNESGIMLHDGWGKVNGSWYYFKNFGAMAEGWVKVGNTWYYLQPGSGKMVTGWNLINGKYYYFDASGAMLANTTTPDGYKVDASGAWVK